MNSVSSAVFCRNRTMSGGILDRTSGRLGKSETFGRNGCTTYIRRRSAGAVSIPANMRDEQEAFQSINSSDKETSMTFKQFVLLAVVAGILGLGVNLISPNKINYIGDYRELSDGDGPIVPPNMLLRVWLSVR